MTRLHLFRNYDSLLAKEMVDVVRSGMVSKMLFAYVAPLLFLSLSTWYINTGLDIPVGFNAVFYAGMVGFFGVLMYNWLTNTDLNDYYETLPVDVPMIIRVKLMAYFLLTSLVSTAFVIGIAMAQGETELLWVALAGALHHHRLHGGGDRLSYRAEDQLLPLRPGGHGQVRHGRGPSRPRHHDTLVQPVLHTIDRIGRHSHHVLPAPGRLQGLLRWDQQEVVRLQLSPRQRLKSASCVPVSDDQRPLVETDSAHERTGLPHLLLVAGEALVMGPGEEHRPHRAAHLIFWSYELFRMLRPQDQLKIAGLRDYEYRRVSAATWALTGMFMCFLAFPIEYTAPALCGMAWVDPIIGELRRSGSTMYPVLPLTIYFSIVLIILTIFMGLTPAVLFAAIVATLIAIFIEGFRLWRLDDDLTMMVLPCVTIAAWFTLVGMF